MQSEAELESFPSTSSESTVEPVKKKYGTNYNESYTEEFSCILPSGKGSNFVFCNVCGTHVSIYHKEKGDITKHIRSGKHKTADQAAKNCKKVNKDFFQKNDTLQVVFMVLLLDSLH